MNVALVKNKMNDAKRTYAVTTGRGRSKKAHIIEDGEILCSKAGRDIKIIDSETAEKFYDTCIYCERLAED